MRLLGAIIAGGASRRFGSDKAKALTGGATLLDHVARALAAQVDDVLVCGRDWPGMLSLHDRPSRNLGPLGGLNAALHFASTNGFDAVMTSACDMLPLPADLFVRLGKQSPDRPAYVGGQPLMGFWPAGLAADLDEYLVRSDDRSMRAWIAKCGASSRAAGIDIFNFNTPDDLKVYEGMMERAA